MKLQAEREERRLQAEREERRLQAEREEREMKMELEMRKRERELENERKKAEAKEELRELEMAQKRGSSRASRSVADDIESMGSSKKHEFVDDWTRNLPKQQTPPPQPHTPEIIIDHPQTKTKEGADLEVLELPRFCAISSSRNSSLASAFFRSFSSSRSRFRISNSIFISLSSRSA